MRAILAGECDQAWWDELCLWCVEGIGPRRYGALTAAFGTAAAAYRAGPEACARALARPSLAAVLAGGFDLARPERVAGWLARTRTRAVSAAEPGFPRRLAELGEPPWIFVRGAVEALSAPLAALVGTRSVRADGVRLTEEVVRWCVARGYDTVSGGALGVDTWVHRATLARGARSVVVLPAGHGHPAPARNLALFDSVCAGGGCLVSEVPPWRQPWARLFPRRNRLISGLSVLTILVRAPRRSGALITVDWASRQGRPLFVVPGSPGDPTSAGCFQVLRRGARLLASIEDLPWAGGEGPGGAVEPATGSRQGAPGAPSSPRAEAVLAALAAGPADLEELVGRLGWGPADVLAELTRLVLSGRVATAGPGRYRTP